MLCFGSNTYSNGNIIINQDEGGVDASEFSFGRHVFLVLFYLIIGASCQKLNVNFIKKFGLSSDSRTSTLDRVLNRKERKEVTRKPKRSWLQNKINCQKNSTLNLVLLNATMYV